MSNAVLKLDVEWYNEPQLVEIQRSGHKTCDQKEPRGKKRGQKSEVFAYESDDMKKVLAYFVSKEMWIHYLLFALQFNTARRVGDMIGYCNKDTGKKVDGLHWFDFFHPDTGSFRQDIRSFCEQKTGKLASPRINDAMKDAILLYCEKTGCDPSSNHYSNPVFLQLSGTHKGKVLSYSGAQKAIKEASSACGIDYNTGTHSARKSFGATTKLLHPGDASCMEALQGIYNHSSSAITNRYIGLTKKKTDAYVDDIGDFFTEYAVKGKEIPLSVGSPVITVDTEAMFDLIKDAFNAGKMSDGSNDADLVIALMNRLASIKK